jgi:hypothetical protein
MTIIMIIGVNGIGTCVFFHWAHIFSSFDSEEDTYTLGPPFQGSDLPKSHGQSMSMHSNLVIRN